MAKKAKDKKAAAKSKPAKKAAPAKKPAPKKAAVKPKAKPAAKKAAPKKAAAPAKAKPVAKKPAAAPAKPAPAKPIAKPIAKSLPPAPKAAAPAAPKGKAAPEDNRSRYSDAELKEFRELINKKLDEATRDYELLKNTLSHKDDHGTDDTSPTFKLLEDGSDVLSKEETAHLAARQEKYIQNLKNALIRIENKTYGICRVTGKLIPKERLRSVPHATLSIDAKLGQNR
jgi:RNA polymerase-binding transcription factor DksA